MSPNCPEISLNATGLDSFGSEVLYDSSTRWSDLFWESEVLEDEWTPGISFERNKKERSRTRVGLPITLETVGGPATVLACADTGAEENIISADLATTLRLPVSDASSQREFMLASGKIVQAIGQVSALCSFGLETSPFAASIRCIFHVFLTLASPIIMGTAFLDETDTMTTYRERLVRIRRPNLQAPQVYSLGRPRNNMMCYVDGELIVATPDTGSDLDIMTPQFAKDRGLQINDHEEVIEFADGSTALTCGSVQVDLAVRRLEVFSWKVTISKKVDIFLLDQFVHDILIGMDSLEELKVFTENKDALIPVEESSGPLGLHHIRSRGRLDAVKSWVNSKIRSLRKNHPAG